MAAILIFITVWEEHIRAEHRPLKRRCAASIYNGVSVSMHGVNIPDLRPGRMADRGIIVRSRKCGVNAILCVEYIFALDVRTLFFQRQNIIRFLRNRRNINLFGVIGKGNQLLRGSAPIPHTGRLSL